MRHPCLGYSSLPLETPEVLTKKVERNRTAESVLRDTFEAFHLARKEGLRLREVESPIRLPVPSSSSCSSPGSGQMNLPPFDTSLSTSVSSRSLSGDLSGSSTSTRGTTLDMELPIVGTRSRYYANHSVAQLMQPANKRVVTSDASRTIRNSGSLRVKDGTSTLLKVKNCNGHFAGTTKRQRLDTIVLE